MTGFSEKVIRYFCVYFLNSVIIVKKK
jgi:hypothetical protein